MMRAFGDWTPETRFPAVATRFLAEIFPKLDERDVVNLRPGKWPGAPHRMPNRQG